MTDRTQSFAVIIVITENPGIIYNILTSLGAKDNLYRYCFTITVQLWIYLVDAHIYHSPSSYFISLQSALFIFYFPSALLPYRNVHTLFGCPTQVWSSACYPGCFLFPFLILNPVLSSLTTLLTLEGTYGEEKVYIIILVEVLQSWTRIMHLFWFCIIIIIPIHTQTHNTKH